MVPFSGEKQKNMQPPEFVVMGLYVLLLTKYADYDYVAGFNPKLSVLWRNYLDSCGRIGWGPALHRGL
jgi:hypothetical protein